MFKRLRSMIAKIIKNRHSYWVRSVFHFSALAAVTAVFMVFASMGLFNHGSTRVAPSDYSWPRATKQLKELDSIDLERQLKAKSPEIVGLVFFKDLKDVVVLYKGFEKDRFVRHAEVDELKQLAARNGLSFQTKSSEWLPGSPSWVFWVLLIGVLLWWGIFLFLKRDGGLHPNRVMVGWNWLLLKHEHINLYVRKKKWHKAPFWFSVWAVLMCALALVAVSRVFNSAPARFAPAEYAHQVMPNFQAERLLTEYSKSIERAAVIDGTNCVSLVVNLKKMDNTDAQKAAPAAAAAPAPAPAPAAAPAPAPAPTTGAPATPAAPATSATAASAPPAKAAPKLDEDEGTSVGRLVAFPRTREGDIAFAEFVNDLKTAGVPTKHVLALAKDSYIDTMSNPLLIAHIIIVLLMGAFLIGIMANMDQWAVEEAPPADARRATAGGGVVTSGGRRVQIKDEDAKTLQDVAGCDEAVAKFRLVAEWLKDAKAYEHFGAKLPKGVLLYGPPGTGKTLLARALAGEVGGNYFQASASEFIEVYVGVGASRVRQLFGNAKAAFRRTGRPSIVFIDEIDAVGKKRSAHGLSGDGERDQTINQLLTCIQGFDPNNGTLVIAATNMPETLDSGLTRSGRFDFKIEVTKPDRRGRKAIFGVHARNLELESGVDREELFDELSRRAYDFTGADIELAINEARTRAAKRNAPQFADKTDDEIAEMPKIVTREDFHAGIDQVQYGEMIKSRVRSQKERRATAVHEIGHACIPTVLNDDPVSRITIVMTTKSLGLMENPTEEDRYGWSKEQFLNRIKTMLAGRIAEEEIAGQISTGASNDFEKASGLARVMVASFGMSSLGPISIPVDEHGFPRVRLGESMDAKFTATWMKIIEDCEEETRQIIRQNRKRIEYVSAMLLEEETMTGDRFRQLFNSPEAENGWSAELAQADAPALALALTGVETAETVATPTAPVAATVGDDQQGAPAPVGGDEIPVPTTVAGGEQAAVASTPTKGDAV